MAGGADGEPAGGGHGLSHGASLTPHTPHLVCPTAKFLSSPEVLPPEPPEAPARTSYEAAYRQRIPTANSPSRAAAPPPSSSYLFASQRPQPVNTDRWYYQVFQSAPDLIRSLLPGATATANALALDPSTPGDRHYRFEALELKELSHRLDGVLWPRQSIGCAETGSPEFPVVLLEVVVITPCRRCTGSASRI